MGIFTCWFVAEDAEAPGLLSGASDLVSTRLDGVGELELDALGEVAGVRYQPRLVLQAEEGLVLRVNVPFLEAMAAAERSPSLAKAWRSRAEHLRALPRGDVEARVEAIRRCARAGLKGPGVLSVPAF